MPKQLAVGDNASIQRRFTIEDVRTFAELSTDDNAIHLDEDYAANTRFGQRIVHGMLVGSLFSALVGKHLPGEGSIYMTQNLNFKAPVYLDMDITARVQITSIHERKPVVTLQCLCTDNDGNTLVNGEAVMYVPWLNT